MGRMLGCAVLLAGVVWAALEIWVWILASRLLNTHFGNAIGSGGYLLTLGWMGLTVYLGYRLARYHGARVMGGMLNGTAGAHLVGAIGAVLLALPGLLGDIPGLILLLPPVQKAFGRIGSLAVAAIARRMMGKMMGGMGGAFPGGMAGFPGGMAGFPGGQFPGMKPLTPDDRARFPKPPPKTYDTTAEKKD